MQANDYRQVRVTLTEETGGRFTVMVCVKPTRADWTKRHVVHRRRFRMSDPPTTLPAVLALLGVECHDSAAALLEQAQG